MTQNVRGCQQVRTDWNKGSESGGMKMTTREVNPPTVTARDGQVVLVLDPNGPFKEEMIMSIGTAAALAHLIERAIDEANTQLRDIRFRKEGKR